MNNQILKIIFLTILTVNTFSYSCSAGSLDAFLGNSSQNYTDVVVKEVLATDTILLESDEIIYLIGLVSPEPPKRPKEVEKDEQGFIIIPPANPETPLEEQALTFAKQLLEGKHIRLEFDVERKTKEYKSQAYVFLISENLLVNAEILRQGYAQLRIQPPNMKYAEELRQAYREARQEKRGFQGQ